MKNISIGKRVLFAAISLAICAYLGVRFPLLLMFIPFYFYIEAKLTSPAVSVGAALLFGACVAVIMDVYTAGFLLLCTIPMMLIFDQATRKGAPISIALLAQAAVLFIPMIALISGVLEYMPDNIVEYVTKAFEADANMRALIAQNYSSNELFLRALKRAIDLISSIVPAFVMIFALITAYINHMIAGRVLMKKTGKLYIQPSSFCMTMLPQGFLLGAFLSTTFTYLMYYATGTYIYSVLNMNLIIISTFLLAVVGAALLDYLMLKAKIPQGIRVLLLIMLLLLSVTIPMLAVIGMLDTVFKFRLRGI